MKLLLLNPNTSTDVTELMMQVARPAAAPDTTLVSATAPRGVPYIATRAEAQIESRKVCWKDSKSFSVESVSST